MNGFQTSLPGALGALAAGLLSFLSPCVLPLIPVYLSFLSGESAYAIREGTASRRVLLQRTILFIIGFTLVFVSGGLLFGGGMRFIGSSARLIITRSAGILILVLAANTLFDFVPFLRMEHRMQASETNKPGVSGSIRAVLFGMAFAAGWTPCIGPILSSILLFAGSGGNTGEAALLLGFYSVGLGIPFLITAFFMDRATGFLTFMKKHFRVVKILSAILLGLFGIAILTSSLSGITVFFLQAGYALENIAATGPEFIRPIAGFLSKWFTFQGL